MTDAKSVAGILSRGRYRLGSEGLLQIDIANHLAHNSIAFEREVKLSPADRIDFLVEGSIGIEVKAKAVARQIYRQLDRYVAYPQLSALILISNTAMGLPADRTFLTKPELGLAMLHRALAGGLPVALLACDDL